jgi:glycosyltransferase involved in cell wall biosynthesis
MIIVYHKNDKVVKVESTGINLRKPYIGFHVGNAIMQIATVHPQEILVWCHLDMEQELNLDMVPTLVRHKCVFISYNPYEHFYLGRRIGYVDESLFVNPLKNVRYPTWQMSGAVGASYGFVFNTVKDYIPVNGPLDYFLNSVAKTFMSSGLLCYSDPGLLKNIKKDFLACSEEGDIFQFVRQHYKKRWLFLLLFNIFIYERKVYFLPFFKSFFYKSRQKNKVDFAAHYGKKRNEQRNCGVDVIIPTIGRKNYLYDFLNDLKAQTLLPKTVIIVEQNPEPGSTSELDYIVKENWPFKIIHFFTNQAGACNARNLGLEHIRSDWTFFADDDIRIDNYFIEEAIQGLTMHEAKAATICCLQPNEKPLFDIDFQWTTFGSGCSFVASEFLKELRFNIGYEFGFGEDADFGMQLRKAGCDILYFKSPKILHLKAPIGGFRTKPKMAWQNDIFKPKPFPTVMLYMLLHNTKQQIQGYKTVLFFKYYSKQPVKNPFRYYKIFQKEWQQSVFWAKKLSEDVV